VDPSMSVKRKVTVPVGRLTMRPPRWARMGRLPYRRRSAEGSLAPRGGRGLNSRAGHTDTYTATTLWASSKSTRSKPRLSETLIPRATTLETSNFGSGTVRLTTPLSLPLSASMKSAVDRRGPLPAARTQVRVVPRCMLRTRGSRASRTPSPKTLKPNTTNINAMPGTIMRCGASCIH